MKKFILVLVAAVFILGIGCMRQINKIDGNSYAVQYSYIVYKEAGLVFWNTYTVDDKSGKIYNHFLATRPGWKEEKTHLWSVVGNDMSIGIKYYNTNTNIEVVDWYSFSYIKTIL
jgi:hypothetical protein